MMESLRVNYLNIEECSFESAPYSTRRNISCCSLRLSTVYYFIIKGYRQTSLWKSALIYEISRGDISALHNFSVWSTLFIGLNESRDPSRPG